MANKNKKGFTIVELVIVIAIIGVLAAVLIPTFITVVKKSRISVGKQNANQLTLQLKSDCIIDEVAYYETDEIVEKAAAYGLSLTQELEGYSYWYNAAENTVLFGETDEIIHSGADAALFSGGGVIAYAEDGPDAAVSVPIVPESLSTDKNLRFIDCSATVYRRAIDAIYNLPDYGNSDPSAMQSYFDSTMQDIPDETVREYLTSNFSMEKAVYVNESGYFFNNNISSFENMVICKNTEVLATRRDNQPIVVRNKIVVPTSVIDIQSASFTGVSGALVTTLPIQNVAPGGNITVDSSRGSFKNGERLSLGEDYYTIEYGFNKTAKDAQGLSYTLEMDESRATLGNLSDYAALQSNTDELTCEYLLPSLTVNNQNELFKKAQKVSIKSVEINGGVKYYIIAIDADYNAYVIENIGAVTDARLETETTFYQSSQTVNVQLSNEAYSLQNNAGRLYYKLYFRAGYAGYYFDNTVFGENRYFSDGSYYWENSVSSQTFAALGADTSYSVDLTSFTNVDGTGQAANTLAPVRLEIYNTCGTELTQDDVMFYVQYYPQPQRVDGSIVEVHFLANDGTDAGTSQQIVKNRLTDLDSNTFIKKGYSFDTWNTRADGTGESYSSNNSVILSEDITLYAQWMEKSYTVYFRLAYAKPGTITYSSPYVQLYMIKLPYTQLNSVSCSLDAEAAEKLNLVTQIGFTEFCGWSSNYLSTPAMRFITTDIFAPVDIKNLIDTGVLSASSTSFPIYARFKSTQSVTLNANGGVFAEGESTITLEAPYLLDAIKNYTTAVLTVSREGYTLKGWYLNPECTGPYITNAQLVSTRYVMGLQYYAKWVPNS